MIPLRVRRVHARRHTPVATRRIRRAGLFSPALEGVANAGVSRPARVRTPRTRRFQIHPRELTTVIRPDGGPDALDHSVAFLKQRDGLDKTLKLMRYVSAIAAYNILADDPSSVTGTKLRKLDKSTGITRKYLKLGKFLGNLKELRALLRAGEIASRQRIAPAGNRTPDAALASAAAFANRLNIASQLAQLVYNFAEQLNWAAKIGLIRDARRRRKIERWTSVAELATYVFTINVSMLTLWRCAQRETRARREYGDRGRRKKDDDAADAAAAPRRRCDFSEAWVCAVDTTRRSPRAATRP